MSNSLIENVPECAGPSAVTLVQSADRELEKLDWLEAKLGRSTSFTRWRREQLLEQRKYLMNMVN